MTAAATVISRILLATALLAGCDEDSEDPADDDGNPMSTMGRVSMRFSVGGNVKDSASLVDPLSGSVYGSLFRTAQVSVTGPADDAEDFGDVFTESVDLTQAERTEVLWESEETPPDRYTFLGFLDVDASSQGSDDPDPEDGDPVTLPTVNQFEIVEGEVVEIEISFDLVF